MPYSVLEYSYMAADGLRMDAYARAIARTVKPGSVVVDMGAGTGIFALLAAKAGAKRVHAIDPNPSVWLLQDLARENGVADRIVVHHASSFDVDVAERASVIVADMRGSFPIYQDHFAALRDAKARMLEPGGTLVPGGDRLFIAAVENEPLWRQLETGWTCFERRGLSAAAARTSVLNTATNDSTRVISANHVLSTPVQWGAITYGEDFPNVFEPTLSLQTARGGVAHGFALWFETTLLEGIGYGNAPGNISVYNRTFLPLLEPVSLDVGDVVDLVLRVDARGMRWGWDTEIKDASGKRRARFRQSTFLGSPTSPEALLRESTSFTPSLSSRGERARQVLASMDGKTTVQDLSDALPKSDRDNVDEVRDLVRSYGR